MKRLLILIYSIITLVLAMNFIYYRSLYNTQINYIINLLDRQAHLTGLSVDKTNNNFLSDFNRISFDEDLQQFFINSADQRAAIDQMKLFFSKYDSFVIGIKLFDNQKNEFTLKRDPDTNQWLEQSFVLHHQGEIVEKDILVESSRRFEFFLPLIKDNVAVGNMVVTVDYNNYFSALFMGFNLKDYQWQWVVSNAGEVIFNNHDSQVEYQQLDKIIKDIYEGKIENSVHHALIDGKEYKLISAYYSTQLLQRDFGIVFSAPTDFFQNYIIRNSLFIVGCSLLFVMVIIVILWRRIRRQEKTILKQRDSEEFIYRLMEEMPVCIIIHNKNREIIKANHVAAKQYSYDSEKEMEGKIFPESYLANINSYLTKASDDDTENDNGEIALYRRSLPITLKGEDATLEILFDITMIKSAVDTQAKTDSAQSEFFSRMSHEIRTPLNGIIGMTDLLEKHKLSDEVVEIVSLLRQSAEILLNIVNNIFNFSKIESGHIILDEVSFNIRDELNYCAGQAKKSLPGKVKFQCNIDNGVPKNIIGDRFRLRQVLINLINHSIANTNEGKVYLECTVKNIERGVITLMFTLTDTGVLFDKASINKIFGEYLNFDVTNIKISDNIVFGAIVAKKLIELMGGELYAESPAGLVENKGLKVEFSIPVFTNNLLNKNVDISNVKTFKDIKALAVTGAIRDEDTINNLHKIGIDLKITTYQKFTINQIKNNLNFSGEQYNLIIIFDSEDLNGFDVASEIWENNLFGSFIQFFISQKDNKGNYSKCIKMGIDQYLTKPVEITELIQAVKTCFPEIIEKPAAIKSVDKNEIKILVAEDNIMNQRIISSMVKFFGYNFELAEDGYEAYKKATSQKYDLIIIDISMPKMDGFEASERIIEHDKDALIVAISADNNPELIEKSELVGIKEFLPKPVRIEDLKKVFAKYF